MAKQNLLKISCPIFLLLTFFLTVAAFGAPHRWTANHRNVDARDKYGQTGLMHAASHNDIIRLKRLLHSGANINARDDMQMTPLSHAIARGRLRLVRYLLDHGAYINAMDIYGTPLIQAVRVRDAPLVAFLLSRGADLQAQDVGNGDTPISWALQLGDVRIARILIGHGALLPSWEVNQNHWLMFCEMNNYNAFAKLLLDRGANPNVQCEDGLNTLIDAAKFGRTNMVKLLISRGADLNARMKTGMTAMQWAQVRGHGDILEILRRAGEKQ